MKFNKEILIAILAFLGVIAPLSILAVLLIKQTQVDALVAGFIGVIVGSYTTIFSYYFGSSSGSQDKQQTIDKMTTKDDSK